MSGVSSDSSQSSTISTNILVLSNILYPVIQELEKSSPKDTPENLRALFCELENKYPGFARNFIELIIEKELPHFDKSMRMNELTLKLEKHCDKTPYLLSLKSTDESHVEFNQCAKHLKIMLSHIPDEIHDKRIFLERIKEIASAIKKALDSVSKIYQNIPPTDQRQPVELQKKEFIRASKHFSNVLKAYFQDNQAEAVFVAANILLVQTDYLLRAVKTIFGLGTVDPSLYPLYSIYQQQIKQQANSRPSTGAASTQNQRLASKPRPNSGQD